MMLSQGWSEDQNADARKQWMTWKQTFTGQCKLFKERKTKQAVQTEIQTVTSKSGDPRKTGIHKQEHSDH